MRPKQIAANAVRMDKQLFILSAIFLCVVSVSFIPQKAGATTLAIRPMFTWHQNLAHPEWGIDAGDNYGAGSKAATTSDSFITYNYDKGSYLPGDTVTLTGTTPTVASCNNGTINAAGVQANFPTPTPPTSCTSSSVNVTSGYYRVTFAAPSAPGIYDTPIKLTYAQPWDQNNVYNPWTTPPGSLPYTVAGTQVAPVYGSVCQSTQNSCGQTLSNGTVQCDGSCSSTQPSDASCPPTVSLGIATSSQGIFSNSVTIFSNQHPFLQWNSSNAISCTAVGGFSTLGALSNAALDLGPLTSSTNYQIYCDGSSTSTTTSDYLGYVSFYWGDPTIWGINCDNPFYFPPNGCMQVHADTAHQTSGPPLAPGVFVDVHADPATANGITGIIADSFRTSAIPFPGSPLPNTYASVVATDTPNYLGYVSWYWDDPTIWTINCDAPFYFGSNTCLTVNVPGGVAQQLDGPPLAPGEFVAIYADPATSNGDGLNAWWYRTSTIPFSGSPLPNGYSGTQRVPAAQNTVGGRTYSNVVTATVISPNASIVASSNRVKAGSSTSLTWSATGVSACSVKKNGVVWQSTTTPSTYAIATTTVSDPTVTTQTTYQIFCRNFPLSPELYTTATQVVNVTGTFNGF